MRAALARHDALLRSCIENRGGYVFKTIGDAFCAAFAVAGVLVRQGVRMAPHDSSGSASLRDAVRRLEVDGFAVLPEFLSAEDLAPAQSELPVMFPAAREFHEGIDKSRNARYQIDEFAGIVPFPFQSVELCLLAAHPRLVTLAEAFLGTEDLRIYSAEAWAKYTGAADYDQLLHRDYLNHTLLVPSDEPSFRQVEVFLYLCDVPEELGPPHFVSRRLTRGAPAMPNWIARSEKPDWYAAEQSGTGPAGTAVAYDIATFHRGTGLKAPDGARYSLLVSFRAAATEWAIRCAWSNASHEPAWYAFVRRATARQLQLFGFPPPGHPFWTEETLAGMALRYPELDVHALHARCRALDDR